MAYDGEHASKHFAADEGVPEQQLFCLNPWVGWPANSPSTNMQQHQQQKYRYHTCLYGTV
jgi:hypothetical protein